MKTLRDICIKSIGLAAVLMLSGCADFLNRDHPTAITDDQFWNTIGEVEAALGSCKSWPHGTYHYTDPYFAIVHLEGATDNMYWNGNFRGEIVNIGNGSVTPTTGGYIDMIWRQYYIYIRRCNRLLENIHRAYFPNEADRKRIIAETRVWRAWYHIQLLKYYGLTDGIPIVDHALNPEENYMARSSKEDCLTFINQELQAVIDSHDLPFMWDEGSRSRMSESVAWVLMMDINLQLKNYAVAKTAAQAIINSGTFELHYTSATDDDPGKNFRDLFRYVGKQNKERILFTSGGLAEVWARSMGVLLGGQGAHNPLQSLVDAFETIDGKTLAELSAEQRTALQHEPLSQPRDPRLYASVMMNGDKRFFNLISETYTYSPFNPASSDAIGGGAAASRTGYFLAKFLDPRDYNNPWGGSLDFVHYRYAEVLLSYVECLVESGDWQNGDVEKYINQVRARAGMPAMDKTVYNSQDKVRELYRRERRVELAFEGKRYFDIRRWGIGSQVMAGNVEGAWNPNTGAYVVVESRVYSAPKNDVWPVPQEEINANKNITKASGW